MNDEQLDTASSTALSVLSTMVGSSLVEGGVGGAEGGRWVRNTQPSRWVEGNV